MTNTIVTPDGKRHWIASDSHYRDLVREYMGNDAADWYEHRLEDFGNIQEIINTYIPNRDSVHEINQCLDAISLDQWHELFWTLSELRGWDE
jgi:hypothetical protein